MTETTRAMRCPTCDTWACDTCRVPLREAESVAASLVLHECGTPLGGAECEPCQTERRGLALLTPRHVEELTRLADAGSAKHRQTVGDITADVASDATRRYAVALANGASADDARTLALSVRDAVRAAITAARRSAGDSDHGKTANSEEVPTLGAMAEWSDDAKIKRAERYTRGDLRTRTASEHPRFGPFTKEHPETRVSAVALAEAVLMARTLYAWPRTDAIRSIGGTLDTLATAEASAERTYWRTVRHAALVAAFRATAGDTLTDALHASYRPARVAKRGSAKRSRGALLRSAGIGWRDVARRAGVHHTTVTRSVRSAAAAALRIVASTEDAVTFPGTWQREARRHAKRQTSRTAATTEAFRDAIRVVHAWVPSASDATAAALAAERRAADYRAAYLALVADCERILSARITATTAERNAAVPARAGILDWTGRGTDDDGATQYRRNARPRADAIHAGEVPPASYPCRVHSRCTVRGVHHFAPVDMSTMPYAVASDVR